MASSLSDYISRNRAFFWPTAGALGIVVVCLCAVGPRVPWFGPEQDPVGALAADRPALAKTAETETASARSDRNIRKEASGSAAKTIAGHNAGSTASGALPEYPSDVRRGLGSDASINSDTDLELFAALERLERRLAAAIAKARESVVALEYTAPDAPPGTRRVATGVVINQRGDVLSIRIDQPLAAQAPKPASDTSLIVARDFSGRRHAVHWVAADPETGLTLLRLPPRAVRPIRASGRPNLGSQVFVVGNPFGMGHSVSRGHVAGLDRALELGNRQLGGLIQVQAPLYPGDSGAAVVNLQGDWLGLIRSGLAIPGSGLAPVSEAGPGTPMPASDPVSVLATSLAPTDMSLGRSERDTDFGFAIPVQDALWVAEQLRKSGRVDRAYLGVRLEASPSAGVLAVSESEQPLEPTPITARTGAPGETRASSSPDSSGSSPIAREGAILREVLSGTPASQAGLRPGDGIVELDGQPICSTHDLTDRLDRIPARATIQLGVIRDHGPRQQRLAVSLRTASRPETPLVAGPAPPARAVTTTSASAASLGGGLPGPGDVHISASANPGAPLPSPRPDELRLTLPRSIVERLEKLEHRLEKLESFPSRATGTASASDRQISAARNP